MRARIHRDTGKGEGTRYVMEESRSHPGTYHFVDVEAEHCSCPATVRCHHIKKHQCVACDGYGTYISYPKLMTCSHCQGTGRAA